MAPTLLGLEGRELRRRVRQLEAFGGEGSYLADYLAEVLGSDPVRGMLGAIEGYLRLRDLPQRDRTELVSLVADLLLGASLVPTMVTRAAGGRYQRQAIETLSRDRLVEVLDRIARDLRSGLDLLAPGDCWVSWGTGPPSRWASG